MMNILNYRGVNVSNSCLIYDDVKETIRNYLNFCLIALWKSCSQDMVNYVCEDVSFIGFILMLHIICSTFDILDPFIMLSKWCSRIKYEFQVSHFILPFTSETYFSSYNWINMLLVCMMSLIFICLVVRCVGRVEIMHQ